MSEKIDKKVLTTGEIAQYCGVNFRTVIRWIERGHLKAYKLPGRGDNRIELRHFLEFLRENQIPVPEEFCQIEGKILVVEDADVEAKTISGILNKAGYETIVANDGLKAGVMLATHKPALVTLDLGLPGMDGREVLGFVRGIEEIRDVKILVISSYPKDELESMLALGADDILQKPFGSEELLLKVRNLLS